MLVLVTAARDSVSKPRYNPFCVHKPMCNRFPSQVGYSVFLARSLLLYSSLVCVVRASSAGDVYGIEIRRIMAIVEMAGYVLIGERLFKLPWVIGISVGRCFTVYLGCAVL